MLFQLWHMYGRRNILQFFMKKLREWNIKWYLSHNITHFENKVISVELINYPIKYFILINDKNWKCYHIQFTIMYVVYACGCGWSECCFKFHIFFGIPIDCIHQNKNSKIVSQKKIIKVVGGESHTGKYACPTVCEDGEHFTVPKFSCCYEFPK